MSILLHQHQYVYCRRLPQEQLELDELAFLATLAGDLEIAALRRHCLASLVGCLEKIEINSICLLSPFSCQNSVPSPNASTGTAVELPYVLIWIYFLHLSSLLRSAPPSRSIIICTYSDD